MVQASPTGTKVQTTTSSADCRLNTAKTDGDQRRKRRRKDDDERAPPEQIPKDSEQFSRPFACPFYLYNRHRWHNCLRNYTLNRIVDVRLHLSRAHALGPRCPICFEEFRDDPAEPLSADDRFNAHIQLQTCQPLPSPPPSRDGLTRDQFEAVRAVGGRRNGRNAADPAAQKWFEIWDIIFPNVPRPVSPYINDHPDIQRIKDMNDDIFAGEHWRNLTRGSSPSLENASRNTIRTITERLLTFYRLYQDPSRQVTSQSEEIPEYSGPGWEVGPFSNDESISADQTTLAASDQGWTVGPSSNSEGISADQTTTATSDQGRTFGPFSYFESTLTDQNIFFNPNHLPEEDCRSSPNPKRID